MKDSSLSAIVAAGGLGESSTISVLLGGTGHALQQAASHASKAHPSITKAQKHKTVLITFRLSGFFIARTFVFLCCYEH